MSSAFELDDLSDKRRGSSSSLDAVPLSTTLEDFREGTTASWTWAASGMFVVRLIGGNLNLTILISSPSSLLSWSCALIFFPRMLLFAIGQPQHEVMTPLESFLALHFGLLLAFSVVGLVLNVNTPFSINYSN
jgi:hypothetical protein